MVSMERKNIWRREETQRVRQERIITGYIKYRHPEIYSEGMDFFNQLNELYPMKKDLRRTNEFEWLKSGTYKKLKKFYPRQRKNQKKKNKINDNMVLHIPLLAEHEIPQETAVGSEATQETAVGSEAIQETAVGSEAIQETAVGSEATQETAVGSEAIQETAVGSEATQETSATQEIPIELQEVTLPFIRDDIIEDIMTGLRQDPDIQSIFDDFDFSDDCPLEDELLQW